MDTGFLYAKPNFLSGFASVVDISGTLVQEYNYSNTTQEADSRALRSDWAMVGKDIQGSINIFNERHNTDK